MPLTTPSGRRRSSAKATVKSSILRTVRSSVISASIRTFTTSVEPPKAASRVSTSLIASPPEGRKSLVSKTVTSPVAAIPSKRVMIAIATRKGAGLRASRPPRASTAAPTPGMAPAMGRAGDSEPRDSRQRSSSARDAASSVSITIRPAATPTPATTPKSPLAGIGEDRLVRKDTMVVMAASERGMMTARNPRRAALLTFRPSLRCSRYSPTV